MDLIKLYSFELAFLYPCAKPGFRILQSPDNHGQASQSQHKHCQISG